MRTVSMPITNHSRLFTYGAEALDSLASQGAIIRYVRAPVLPKNRRRPVSLVFRFPTGEMYSVLEHTQFERDQDLIEDFLDGNLTFYRDTEERYPSGARKREPCFEGTPRSHGIQIEAIPLVRNRRDTVRFPGALPPERSCPNGWKIVGEFRAIPVSLTREGRAWVVRVHPEGEDSLVARRAERRKDALRLVADFVQHTLSQRFF